MSNKDRLLDELEVEDEIESHRMSIAQKKAIEREMKQRHGRDWKKVLGLVGKGIRNIRPNMEAVQTLYGVGLGGEKLRSQRKPRRLR